MQKLNEHNLEVYLIFKRNLLKLMALKDPLQVLESGIFQQYQINIGLRTQLHAKMSDLSKRQFQIQKIEPRIHQSRISKYYFGEQDQFKHKDPSLWVKLIQKRPHSAERYDCQQYKIKRMQQRQHIQLLIWTNIMNSEFQKQRSIQHKRLINTVQYPQQFLLNNAGKKNTFKSPNKKQNLLNKQNQKSQTWQQTRQKTQQKAQKLINYQENNLKQKFQAIKGKIVFNPKGQALLNNFYQFLSEERQKMVEKIHNLSNELFECTQKQMQLGEKQLGIIIRQKQLAKKSQCLKQEYQRKMQVLESSRIQLMERQRLLRKAFGNKVLAFQQQKARLTLTNNKGASSILQELRQKLKIDELRRNTLYELEKQSLNLRLLQQDFEARKRLQLDYDADRQSICQIGQQEKQQEANQEIKQ